MISATFAALFLSVFMGTPIIPVASIAKKQKPIVHIAPTLPKKEVKKEEPAKVVTPPQTIVPIVFPSAAPAAVPRVMIIAPIAVIHEPDPVQSFINHNPQPMEEEVQPVVETPAAAPVEVVKEVVPEVPEQPVEAPKPYTMEIMSPMPPKGLGRLYKAAPEMVDESNYVELGGVLRDGNGNIVDTEEVSVTATDSSQNKTMAGTGNYSPVINGSYYPFHYEFHTSGEHIITFTGHGVSASVTVNVE